VICQHVIGFLDFLFLYLSCTQIWLNPVVANCHFGATWENWKIKKTRILLYSCLPTGIYNKNLAIVILNFFCKSGDFGFFFPVKNPFYKSKSYFSGRNLAKFLQNKRSIWPIYQPTSQGDEKKNRVLMDEETLGIALLIIHGGAIWPC
jgi:hypothetical protein